jgi:hypothetical protein
VPLPQEAELLMRDACAHRARGEPAAVAGVTATGTCWRTGGGGMAFWFAKYLFGPAGGTG